MVAVVAVVAVFVGVLAFAGRSDAASSEQRHGYLFKAGPKAAARGATDEWIGSQILNGKQGICPDYGKATPDGKFKPGDSPASFIRDPALRSAVTRMVNDNWEYAKDSNRGMAALVSAVNRKLSSDYRYDWAKSYAAQMRAKDPAALDLSNRILNSTGNAGKLTAKGQFLSRPGAGEMGTYRVTTQPGAAVLWGFQGAEITRTGAPFKADNRGVAEVGFLRSTTGAVRITATVTVPNASALIWSQPTPGHQHLLRVALHATAKAQVSGRYDSTPAATVESKCDEHCEGKPQVTATAVASRADRQFEAFTGARKVAEVNVPAGQAVSLVIGQGKVTDGEKAVIRYRARAGYGWTGWRTIRTIIVVCPPWPDVTLVKHCACKVGADVVYRFVIPPSARFYRVALTEGGRTQVKDLRGGQQTELSSQLSKGERVVASWTAYADSKRQHRVGSGVSDDFTQNR